MSDDNSPTGSIESAEWWRAVISEFPTGVALLTTRNSTGEPIGMIVGSFVAISQDPPLVGFFGDDASASFAEFSEAGTFTASVLGIGHERLLRSFLTKDADRFARPGMIPSASGMLRVADAVAWFDATTVRVDRYGDHRLVVGRVEDFGVGTANAGVPIVYRRGGFGSFAVPTDSIDVRVVGERVAAARTAATQLTRVADELERDIAITTVVGEAVVVLTVVLSSTEGPQLGAPVGTPDDDARQATGISFPFAAPIEPLFAAWAPDHIRSMWTEQARHLIGSVSRRQLDALLTTVRQRGFAVSTDRGLTRRFTALISNPDAEKESYARMWSEYAALMIESSTSAPALDDVATVQVPVFDDAGNVALVLTVSDVGPFPSPSALEQFAGYLVEVARTVGAAISSHRHSSRP